MKRKALDLIRRTLKEYGITKMPVFVSTRLIDKGLFFAIKCPAKQKILLPFIIVNLKQKGWTEILAHELAHYITYYIFNEPGHTKNFLYIYQHITASWNLFLKSEKAKKYLIKQNRRRISLKLLLAALKKIG